MESLLINNAVLIWEIVMKSKFIFTLVLLLFLQFNDGYADDKLATNDMFGLEMTVIAPFLDVLDDGVDMDTVRY